MTDKEANKAIPFFKDGSLLFSFPVLALTISFRVWPGTFAEVMNQPPMPGYDPVTARDSGVWPLPAPEWLPTPVIKMPARPEFSARPDYRDGIQWWKELYRELERQLTGKNAEKEPGNEAKSSKLWAEREKLNHLNDPESSDPGLMGYFEEDDKEDNNNYSSADDRVSETVLLAINPSPSIDNRSGTPFWSSDTLTTSSAAPRQVPTGTNDHSEENPVASTSTVPEPTSLPTASATDTSGMPKQTPFSNLAVIEEELARESEQCLEEYMGSHSCRVMKSIKEDIISKLEGFDVEEEPYLKEARQDPKAFSDKIRERRKGYEADNFPFPETEPVVNNMKAGIHFFLQNANNNESSVYDDFLTFLDEVKVNNYRYREVMLACWIFTVLADFYYSVRMEYDRAGKLRQDESLLIDKIQHNPESLLAISLFLTKQRSFAETLSAGSRNTQRLKESCNYLLPLLNNTDALFLPGFSPLDIDFFDKTTPYLLMAASLLNQPLAEADGTLMSPHFFFAHDTAHAYYILRYAGGNSDCLARQPYEPFRDALVNFLAKARQVLPESVSMATTLTLFYFQHESSKALWQLPDLPILSYFIFAYEMQASRKDLEYYSDTDCRVLIMENPNISDSHYLYATLFLWIAIQQTKQYRQQPETINIQLHKLISEIRHKWENAVNLTRLARKISRPFIDYVRATWHPDREHWEQLLKDSNREPTQLFRNGLITDTDYLIYFLLIALDPDQASRFFQKLREWLDNHPGHWPHLIEALGSDDFQWLVPESFLPPLINTNSAF